MATFDFSLCYTLAIMGVFMLISLVDSISEGFNSNISCKTRSTESEIICTWPIPEVSSGKCGLSYRGTNHLDDSSCARFEDWNGCPQEDERGCTFRRYWIMPHCTHYVEMKLICTSSIDGHFESEVIEVSYSAIIIPNPPRAVNLHVAGKRAMNVTWKLPKGWPISDLVSLKFSIRYWQEVGGVKTGNDTIHLHTSQLSTLVRNLKYAFASTCVKVGAGYEAQIEWSEVVCGTTSVEKPQEAPGNLTATAVGVGDPSTTSKILKLTWEKVPQELHGSPGLSYEIRVSEIPSDNISLLVEVPGNTSYYVLDDLDPYKSYQVEVVAVNEEGRSSYARITLPADKKPDSTVTFRRYAYAGFAVIALVVHAVMLSSAVAFRRKCRRAARKIDEVEIKRHTVSVDVYNNSTKEKEVFDAPGKMAYPDNNNSPGETVDPEQTSRPIVEELVDPLLMVVDDWLPALAARADATGDDGPYTRRNDAVNHHRGA